MIRQATMQDITGISSLIRTEPGMWQDAWADNVINRALKSSNGLAFVWDNCGILGFVCGHDVGFRGYLSELVVATHARRKGIGRQLVMHVQGELTKRGCHHVMADIWHGAEPFYESLGWVPVSNMVSLRKKDLRIYHQ
ncbi:MAG: GNAT family N-acetyltransferase [Proteobacteria bacterium]|nr:GNAT family N-acetyltransferase [Pseudomonadota bacterium]MBU1582215.1 GNAT family N-acetyltransferase [Pseudomonadota bacterium]MBU2455599.1 GNAT family N-acetyltransferase [Pseudomonadota bacterium]MBU2627065.1 GNAT family N-acetyltransferase [Pseudomonadota bacterium]